MELLYGLFVAFRTFTEVYVNRRKGVEASKPESDLSISRHIQYLLTNQDVFNLVILISAIWFTYTYTRNQIHRSRDSLLDAQVRMNEQLREDHDLLQHQNATLMQQNAEILQVVLGLSEQIRRDRYSVIENISLNHMENVIINTNAVSRISDI